MIKFSVGTNLTFIPFKTVWTWKERPTWNNCAEAKKGAERRFLAASSYSASNWSSSSESGPELMRCPDRLIRTRRGCWSSSAWAVVAVAGVMALVKAGTGTGVSLRSSFSLSLGSSSKSSPAIWPSLTSGLSQNLSPI